MKTLLAVVSLCAALLGVGCTTQPFAEPALGAARGPYPPTDDSLFRALGGHAGIESLSERFIRELAADDTTRAFFTRTDIGRFHRLMQEQMCAESGGGCTYTGDDMRTAHAGLNITRRDMNAVVEALMRAMDKEGLPIATQNALLAIHAPKRADVLGE